VQSLRILLPDATAENLNKVAAAAFRSPRQQASVLLIEAIERAAREAARHDVHDGRDRQRRRVDGPQERRT